MATTEPIRNKRHIKQMTDFFRKKDEYRNALLITMGANTALRISDLLSLCWEDVYDFSSKTFFEDIHIIEKKTGKPQQVTVPQAAVKDMRQLLKQRQAVWGGDLEQGKKEPLFCNNRKNRAAISRVQAYRIIRKVAEILNIPGKISCHSLRKSFGYHARFNGVSLEVLIDIYNHSSYYITRRYLGITQDEKRKAYRKSNLG